MQTFLPYRDYGEVARCLDRERLSKQRIEAAQILCLLLGLKWDVERMKFIRKTPDAKTLTHPAVAMWRGAEGSLYQYALEMCEEYRLRGNVDMMSDRLKMTMPPMITAWGCPEWTMSQSILASTCSSHRSVLLGKDFNYYSQYGWLESPAAKDPITNRWPYFWPASTR